MLDLPPISQSVQRNRPALLNFEYQQPPLIQPVNEVLPIQEPSFFDLEYPEVPVEAEKTVPVEEEVPDDETEEAPVSEDEVEVEQLYSSVELITLMTELRDQLSSEINDMRIQGYRTRVSIKMIQEFMSKLQ